MNVFVKIYLKKKKENLYQTVLRQKKWDFVFFFPFPWSGGEPVVQERRLVTKIPPAGTRQRPGRRSPDPPKRRGK